MTHANTSNLSDQTRYVCMVAAGPEKSYLPEMVAARQQAFTSGLGSNVRDALMHASMKPRYTEPESMEKHRHPEQLTVL